MEGIPVPPVVPPAEDSEDSEDPDIPWTGTELSDFVSPSGQYPAPGELGDTSITAEEGPPEATNMGRDQTGFSRDTRKMIRKTTKTKTRKGHKCVYCQTPKAHSASACPNSSCGKYREITKRQQNQRKYPDGEGDYFCQKMIGKNVCGRNKSAPGSKCSNDECKKSGKSVYQMQQERKKSKVHFGKLKHKHKRRNQTKKRKHKKHKKKK
jgi:hypothetical protein